MHRTFQDRLESTSGLKLKLKINDNRSTMLSVKWEAPVTKVSLHRMFLEAPQNIMDKLACYLRQDDPIICPSVKQYMETKLQHIDKTDEVKSMDIYPKGKVYDLEAIYHRLNKKYFNNQLKLSITWYGFSRKCCRSRIILGLYEQTLRLIKINRLLDDSFYPEYVVSYIVYHEMLHEIYPSYFLPNGKHKVHTKEFKAQEKLFCYYEAAEVWLKENKMKFFLQK